ncbi:MAG: hypothetical protein WKF40_05265 [Thermoleophilaceae bacterium]
METLDARAALRLSSISGDQPHAFRAQAADTAARSLREAEPELEKLVRSGYRTFVAWARRGEAERAAYNLDRVRASFLDGQAGPGRAGRVLRRGQPARRLPLAEPQARDPPRAPPAARAGAGRVEPGEAPRRTGHGRGRPRQLHRPPGGLRRGALRPRHRALHRLRDEDRGRSDPRLPRARVPRRRPGVRAVRSAAQDHPSTWAPTPATRRSPSSAARAGSR